ncbi:DUF1294 domain-containing protein [Clostridium thermobutyricum]|uniref:DUF1294 domain-containing protein n=2 Tax=Clostridium thermobutyricum TaxID=29372 RepID=N9Y4K2_9CLOT|nr:DUF1294 domain-containing protein [Clostridium thermobutyricum]ENZ03104.1 hypothetical protein HMPREF1092_00290 [Clostridium thermobutyricum]OPX47389.1 hypothetical protein CLTHE_19520 [Clostridium thermobutyricum DSM 4928]
MHAFIGAYLLLINIIGFLSMFIDKRKAINHKWRISEAHLLSIPILGGGFGSWVGMYTFRHKTSRIKFNLGIPLIIAIQLILIFLIFGRLY